MSYSVVFTGELKPSISQETVINNLSILFKKDAGFIRKLFNGPQVTIKRGLDLESANKYKIALESAGALCEVLAAQQAQAATSALSMAEAGETILAPVEIKSAQIDISGYSMAEPGTQIIETPPVQATQISALNADLLPPGSILKEQDSPKTAQIDTSSITLAHPDQDSHSQS